MRRSAARCARAARAADGRPGVCDVAQPDGRDRSPSRARRGCEHVPACRARRGVARGLARCAGGAARARGVALGLAFGACLSLRVPRAELVDGYAAAELSAAGSDRRACHRARSCLCDRRRVRGGHVRAGRRRGASRRRYRAGPASVGPTVLRRIEGIATCDLGSAPSRRNSSARRSPIAGCSRLCRARAAASGAARDDRSDQRCGRPARSVVSSARAVPARAARRAHRRRHAAALARRSHAQRAASRRWRRSSERARLRGRSVYSLLGEQALGRGRRRCARCARLSLLAPRTAGGVDQPRRRARSAAATLSRRARQRQRAVDARAAAADAVGEPRAPAARARSQRDAARDVLELAERAGVRDARLDQLRARSAR